mmetsp:Transcript_29306/g.95514  ORF Transcript_29306/g.95514 Transcript_29306/m.95514 type:complete len:495 (-) Transcript_29306:84-1568(-)
MAALRLPLLVVLLAAACAQEPPPRDAGALLREGDEALRSGNVAAAIRHYGDAISADPESALLYTKRAGAHMQRKDLAAALKDLDRCVELDPKSVSGLFNRGKLLRQLCSFDRAKADLARVLELKPAHGSAPKEMQQVQQMSAAMNAARSARAQRSAAKLRIAIEGPAGECPEALLWASELDFAEGEYESAVASTGKLLKMEPGSIEALLLRGRAYVRLMEYDTGKRHFAEALQRDPEHKETLAEHRKVKNLVKKTNQASEAEASGDWEKAAEAFARALEVDPEHTRANIDLHMGLCRVNIKRKDGNAAVRACTEVLNLDANRADALLQRAEAHIIADNPKAAQADGNNARQRFGNSREVIDLLQRCERLIRMAERKDYYATLGISKQATAAEIKRAYKKGALQWHPDKCKDELEVCEKNFHEVGEAYEILGDEDMRLKYDRGEDVSAQAQAQEEMRQQQGGHPFGGGFGGFGGGFPGGGFGGGGQRFTFRQGGF